MEQKIYEYFYSGDTELRLSYLTAVKQKHNEPVAKYIRRFRDTRNWCFNLNISDKDLAVLAYSVLTPHLKDKLESHVFSDVSQVLQRALDCESGAKESRNFPRSSKKSTNERHVNTVKHSSESSNSKEANMCVAEWSWGSKSKPFVCSSLKLASKCRQDETHYTFDVAMCDRIFDYLLQENKLNCQVIMSYHHRNNSKRMLIVNDIILILMLLMIAMFSIDRFVGSRRARGC